MEPRYFLFLLCLLTLDVAKGFFGKKLNIDKEHLKTDFLNLLGSWSEMFLDAEMDFRFFEIHDLNKDKQLDGLELLKALEHDAVHKAKSNEGVVTPKEELEKDVEAIFSEHDKNGDGFLEYREFMTVHKTHPDINSERIANKHNEL